MKRKGSPDPSWKREEGPGEKRDRTEGMGKEGKG